MRPLRETSGDVMHYKLKNRSVSTAHSLSYAAFKVCVMHDIREIYSDKYAHLKHLWKRLLTQNSCWYMLRKYFQMYNDVKFVIKCVLTNDKLAMTSVEYSNLCVYYETHIFHMLAQEKYVNNKNVLITILKWAKYHMHQFDYVYNIFCPPYLHYKTIAYEKRAFIDINHNNYYCEQCKTTENIYERCTIYFTKNLNNLFFNETNYCYKCSKVLFKYKYLTHCAQNFDEYDTTSDENEQENINNE
ncbi:hypothetical protein [Urbanus proteus nucleopolyhedrovirus]|uniref:Uncharacterized protein n=1 Tax=Urbanus proteus nucleopolyhedrovirus TaxID=1675866 RepID=A0A162GTQ1_9ABAC|nr:hypothetical protein [Urbanus proteus nucleopolyhedrovirus]AKR17287.1 hypothetical protein [Urbanus proteus nucleopolyhedrovirus]